MSETVDPWVSEKQAAGAAACFVVVEAGMRIGIGSGSTVTHFISPLARRHLQIRWVAASLESERLAREAGLHVKPSMSSTGWTWP